MQEHDFRVDLFKAIAERAKKELNLKLRGLFCYGGESALLIPNEWECEECALYLPVSLTNDVLYHPGDRDWEEIAKSLQFEIGVFAKKDRSVIEDDLSVTPAEFCRNFWSAFGVTDAWYGTDDEEEPEKKPKKGFLNRIRQRFAKA